MDSQFVNDAPAAGAVTMQDTLGAMHAAFPDLDRGHCHLQDRARVRAAWASLSMRGGPHGKQMLPTLGEAGPAGLEITAGGALVAPPGTPAAAIDRLDRLDRLDREVNGILQDAAVQAQRVRLALTPIGRTARQFRDLATEERRTCGEVVRKSGAKVD